MTKKLRKKHDSITKKFLTDIEIAKEFIGFYLDSNIIARCDINILTIEPGSYIDDGLSNTLSDILYKINLKTSIRDKEYQ